MRYQQWWKAIAATVQSDSGVQIICRLSPDSSCVKSICTDLGIEDLRLLKKRQI
ncbi:hypothetical protein H6F95_02845 [Cyanobacteria bacterium FACHB-471]|nr:hypothetical protein [Cyanobacteria bacterium FACHB-471]